VFLRGEMDCRNRIVTGFFETSNIDKVPQLRPRQKRAEFIGENLSRRINDDSSDRHLFEHLWRSIFHEIDDDAFGWTLQKETPKIGRSAQRLHLEREAFGNISQRSFSFINDVGYGEEIKIVSDAMMEVKSHQRCASREEELVAAIEKTP
ncbi:MAG: hypothetical protein QOE68_4540, partial [Thermoanaerobaculia bacterium]|nr:hypothetical protein [Thermoanaerobaculia bacterium]